MLELVCPIMTVLGPILEPIWNFSETGKVAENDVKTTGLN